MQGSVQKVLGFSTSSSEEFTHVEFLDGLEVVSVKIFQGLTSVVLPQSFLKLQYANITLKETETIYYKGTALQWENVEIEREDKVAEYLTVYFYSKDEPEEEGNFWHYNSEGEIEVWE